MAGSEYIVSFIRVSQSTLNAIKDIVDNGFSLNVAAKRHNVQATAVRQYMILYGIKLNDVNSASHTTARIGNVQAALVPKPEELREVESIVDVQENRQYLVKWQDAAEEEWVDEATFLAAVN